MKVDRSIWESQRLLDRSEEATDSPFVDQFLRDRANRSLEHVFTLLSLILPKQPLIVAFRGLHTTDELLRGTALEYLEAVLPETCGRVCGRFSRKGERPGTHHAPVPRSSALLKIKRIDRGQPELLRKERAVNGDSPDPAAGR
jgi:hypothetical protein